VRAEVFQGCDWEATTRGGTPLRPAPPPPPPPASSSSSSSTSSFHRRHSPATNEWSGSHVRNSSSTARSA
jgi:hypothetical protein